MSTDDIAAKLAAKRAELEPLWRELTQPAYAEHAEKLVRLLTGAEAKVASLTAENERLRELVETCSCGTSPMTYEGPEADCPVHGAIRAFNEASARLARAQSVIDAARLLLETLERTQFVWARQGGKTAITEAYQAALAAVDSYDTPDGES